jgi:5-methylcytosine-specific restriction endonuclease McrA
MPALTLPAFHPGQPAEAVDAALRQSLAVCEEARRCAVLWFAEVQRRELWRAFGHPSLELYAVHRLGFSRNRYWQFKRLADDLDRLPVLRDAVSDGHVGWTKAQQVARVATPATAAAWVERAARTGRRELAAAVTAEVARVRSAAAKVARREVARREVALAAGAGTPAGGSDGQLALGLDAAAVDPVSAGSPASASPDSIAKVSIPATVALRADALQVARFEALVEQARKRGLVPAQAGRMELVLAALEQLVMGRADDTGATAGDRAARNRRHAHGAPVQVIVQRCPDCAAATVTTAAGERALAPAQVAALACDARVQERGKPNRATIAPRVRRAVLARDRYRCSTPGCGTTAFLEVHHVVPRSRGGSSRATNLVTLCGRCHAFVHEGGIAPAQVADKLAT